MNRRGFLAAVLAVPLAPLAVKAAASIPVIDNFFLKPLLVKHYKMHVTMDPTYAFGFTGFKPAPGPPSAVFHLVKQQMEDASRDMVRHLNEITYGAT